MSTEKSELDNELEAAWPGMPGATGSPGEPEAQFEADAVERMETRRPEEEPLGPTPVAAAQAIPEQRAIEAAPEAMPAVGQPPAQNLIGELQRRLDKSDLDRQEDRRVMGELFNMTQELLREAPAGAPAAPASLEQVQFPTVKVEPTDGDYEGSIRTLAQGLEATVTAVRGVTQYIQDREQQRATEAQKERRDYYQQRYEEAFTRVDPNGRSIEKQVPPAERDRFWNIVAEHGIKPEKLRRALLIFNEDRLYPVVTGSGNPPTPPPPLAALVMEGGSATRGATTAQRSLTQEEFFALPSEQQDAYLRWDSMRRQRDRQDILARVEARLQ